jgi:hypothetical protein
VCSLRAKVKREVRCDWRLVSVKSGAAPAAVSLMNSYVPLHG